MADRTPSPLDDPAPRGRHRFSLPHPLRGDAFGRGAEAFARLMGTPGFLVGMTIFCAVWLGWNTFLPEEAQFDPRALNYTLLTLILSLQASYAAPLLLLAQNRQDDRDRVQLEQDRQSAERNHATTDFITREIASLRIALNDVATRDFVRGELRTLLEELEAENLEQPETADTYRQHGGAPDAPDAEPTSREHHAALRALLREEVRAALAERDPQATPLPQNPTDQPIHTDQEDPSR